MGKRTSGFPFSRLVFAIFQTNVFKIKKQKTKKEPQQKKHWTLWWIYRFISSITNYA